MREPPDDLHELLQCGFRYALSLTHDATGAEDLLQEAWVAVLAAAGPWRRAYLFSAIRSRFIDHCRRERLVVFEATDDVSHFTAGEDTLNDGAADEVVADSSALDRALATLRPTEREVLFLAAVEGYTAQEIADLTGHPRGTILSLIYRTRRKLRRLLEQGDEEMYCRE